MNDSKALEHVSARKSKKIIIDERYMKLDHRLLNKKGIGDEEDSEKSSSFFFWFLSASEKSILIFNRIKQIE